MFRTKNYAHSIILILALLLLRPAFAASEVEIATSLGNFIVELNDERAPRTVDNFLSYVNSGFYNGTTFHRVIDGFMIQGGGFSPNLIQKPTNSPIPSEAQNGLKNQAFSISAARAAGPDTATSQFFINLKDNPGLDYPNAGGNGYTVFGRITSGFETLDAIRKSPTSTALTSTGVSLRDVPITPIIITSVKIISSPRGSGIAQSSPATGNTTGLNKTVTSVGSSPINIDNAKSKCDDLGFKRGTEPYGKCVLSLSK